MALVIDNKTTSDGYTAACTIQGGVPCAVGFYVVANASVVAQLQTGPFGMGQWGDEFPVSAAIGAGQIAPGATGIRFRSYTKGTPAVVSAALFGKDESGVAGALFTGSVSGGQVTPGVQSVNVQHNDVAVATEPTLDFEDLPLPWSLTDDAPNTRVKIAALIDADGSIPFSRPLKVTNKDSGGGGQNCILYLLNTVSARKAYVYQDDAGELLLGEFGGKNTIVVTLGTGRVSVPYSLASGGLESGGTSAANLMFVQRMPTTDARQHMEGLVGTGGATGNITFTFGVPFVSGAQAVSDVNNADVRSNAHITSTSLTSFSFHAEAIGAGAIVNPVIYAIVTGT